MSKIEWTDETWNPIAGCNDVSEGCRNCYARGMAKRLEAMGQAKYAGLTVLQGSKTVWTGKISFDEGALLKPLRRKKPTRYFVNSMSDLFHPNVTDEQIDRIFAVMASTSQHAYQILTKRPERMLAYINGVTARAGAAAADYQARIRAHFEKYKKQFKEGYTLPSSPTGELRAIYDSACRSENRLLLPDGTTLWEKGFSGGEYHWRSWPLTNVWLGASVENQTAADERIPLLLQTPAAVRFISAEPLLGALHIAPWLGTECCHDDSYAEEDTNATICRTCEEQGVLDWVICGGESGPNARPMHPDWARGLRDQCVAAGVPFFFKQWGEWASVSEVAGAGIHHRFEDGATVRCVGKKAAGDLLDGVQWHQFPEVRP